MHSAPASAAVGASGFVPALAASFAETPAVLKPIQVRHLGIMDWARAFEVQSDLVARRKAGEIRDQILFVEHPHVVTMGRNGDGSNLLASPELLERSGIAFYATDRGGDVTYHGPGQIVCYPILDLRDWKRDVGAYMRGIEETVIRTLAEFGIVGSREKGATGVWVDAPLGPALASTTPTRHQAKVCATGVHISRWVTSHGFALNLDTDLQYFRYIVPCGLHRPVTSMRALGCQAARPQVEDALLRHFCQIFEKEPVK